MSKGTTVSLSRTARTIYFPPVAWGKQVPPENSNQCANPQVQTVTLIKTVYWD